MDTTTLIVLVVVVAALAGAAFWYFQKRRSQQLHGRFGPEYDRTVREYGDRRKAESELERREKRVERFHIRSLPREERDRFAEAWRTEQAHFVDEPQQAVSEAHRLVNEVMRARGYPASAEFEENAADLSVEHPQVVQHYRVACDIAGRQERGQANTEDLRNAMVHYRALFEELLGVRVGQSEEVKR
jgi:FtsZ-interacting cell division protein ZipA